MDSKFLSWQLDPQFKPWKVVADIVVRPDFLLFICTEIFLQQDNSEKEVLILEHTSLEAYLRIKIYLQHMSLLLFETGCTGNRGFYISSLWNHGQKVLSSRFRFFRVVFSADWLLKHFENYHLNFSSLTRFCSGFRYQIATKLGGMHKLFGLIWCDGLAECRWGWET